MSKVVDNWLPFERTPPTAFDNLRFGYFDVAFGNMFKGIRGGTNPVGVITLALCSISAFAQIEWCLDNQLYVLDEPDYSDPLRPKDIGELKARNSTERKHIGYLEKPMFFRWLQKWMVDSGINLICPIDKVYGLRCALVHTGGDSEALNATGVKAWNVQTQRSEEHYLIVPHDTPRFTIYLPDFLSELVLAADRFLTVRKADLLTASFGLQTRVGFLATRTKIDLNGSISGTFVKNKGSLGWFDQRLSVTPLTISVKELSEVIRSKCEESKDRFHE